MMKPLDPIEDLIEDIRQGRMVILVDDEDRENEGDLIMAASHVTPEAVNFMAKYARGLICLTLTPERCEQLNLPLMVRDNQTPYATNFTCSIEAAQGVTTGISAADRAHTIRTAVAPHAKPRDLIQPGHVFPLQAREGGVLKRAGHTEAGCDLARLAGLEATSVIVEIMNDDGSMARRADLEKFAQAHQLKMGSIADLIHYRVLHESTVTRAQSYEVKTVYGSCQVVAFEDSLDNQQTHLAIIFGDLAQQAAPYVRVHIGHPLRDWLGVIQAKRSSWSLPASMQWLGQHQGVLVLIDQAVASGETKRALQSLLPQAPSEGDSPPTPSYRNIGTGSQILRSLGIRQMRLLSSKLKFNALSGFDLEIIEYIDPPAADPSC
jgi:3,4-dihydroxy 2-butanone 4-phosphate synthase/GTP cyclohydrolase II